MSNTNKLQQIHVKYKLTQTKKKRSSHRSKHQLLMTQTNKKIKQKQNMKRNKQKQ